MAEPVTVRTCVLIADVTASVALYERLGDAAAYARIVAALGRVRDIVAAAGGEPVQSRGDDVLSFFEATGAAFEAAREMLIWSGSAPVTLRVSLHWGDVIRTGDSVYGDAINVSYRLVALSNPGEALVTAEAADKMPLVLRSGLAPLDAFHLRNRSRPVEVFALRAPTTRGQETTLPESMRMRSRSAGRFALRIHAQDGPIEVREAESLSVGRSEDCDLTLDAPWVSRLHAVLHVRDGVAVLVDRSSYGTFVHGAEGSEIYVHRQTATLSGTGRIGLGARAGEAGPASLGFDVAATENVD